ncbi:9044_t:CDS:2 [Scutellospora calospora]|uniref:9044_t:CDS:1 n=1 Tax=Scutellospora calospora TaxID=85575 RepID=A0ACA9L3I3_9GLOM|nr:9044_t:CDS:2 [Scutellospora calospora]
MEHNKRSNRLDPEEFIDSFHSYLVAIEIDVAAGHAHRIRAHSQARNIVIPAYTVFDKDWSFADRYPTDRIVNLSNANVTAEKQRMLFGSTVQGSDPVGQFYSKLRKLARLAGIDEQQIRLQFIHSISPDNQLEIRRIRINRPVSELLTELEEIERYKTEQLSRAYLYSGTDKSYKKDNNSSDLGMTKTEIENLIKSMMPSIQEMKTQHFGLKVTDNDPVEDMCKQLENLQINLTKMKKAIKKNSSKPKSSNHKTKTKSRTKKSSQSKRVNAHIISDESSSDSSDSENSTISSENELETNTLACSWNESESDFSRTSESSNSENDSEEYEINTIKKKITFSDSKRSKKYKSARSEPERSLRSNKTSTKKSSNASNKKDSKVRPERSLLRNTRSLKIPTDNISLNAFFTILRSMVNSFTHTQPKEVSINSYNMINAKFIALKDPVLNHFTLNFSNKE